MDLRLEQAEVPVGGFFLDLLGFDEGTGEQVIVENQLEGSDHYHLGQLLTYAGGLDPVNIVWVAESFRAEHRAALSWLNEHTDERTRFFAVEVAAARIGSSPFAPLFEAVVQPNDWQKQVRPASSSLGRTTRQETHRRFWAEWLEQLHVAAPGWTNARQALAQNWMSLPTGMSGVNYAAIISRTFVAVEIFFGDRDPDVNAARMKALSGQRAVIDGALGAGTEWQELPGRKGTRIRVSMDADIDDEATWPQHQAWMLDRLVRLRAAINSLGGLPALLRDVRFASGEASS